MRVVFSSQDPLKVRLMEHVLAEHGIECLIENENLMGASGGIPPTESWPALVVLDVERLDEAKAIIARESASAKTN